VAYGKVSNIEVDTMEIDYSKYNASQLLEAKRNIDPKVASENYKNLINEIEIRKDEVERFLKEQEESYKQSTFNKVKAVAYLQLVGGAIFFIFCLLRLISDFSLLDLVFSIAFSGLSIVAGWHLLKGNAPGYLLTYANQVLQLPVIYTSSFVYDYTALGGVFVGVGDSGLGIIANFDPGFLFLVGNINTSTKFSIDILALAIIFLLGRKTEIEDKVANIAHTHE
jgi:hypothetical protein